MQTNSGKLEYQVILNLIQSGSSILDLGCGEGDLMAMLVKEKKVKAQGIEINEQCIYKCVTKGLSVFHGDIDSGLADYSNDSFDYVILNQSLQQVKKPETVLKEALRVSKNVIVGFPNFAHYSARFQLAIKGKAPITNSLPYEWHDTPNVHFLSIADFKEFCRSKNIQIAKAFYLGGGSLIWLFPNFRALTGIFLIKLGLTQHD
jgi:methionine biosynthesis protein MetW